MKAQHSMNSGQIVVVEIFGMKGASLKWID